MILLLNKARGLTVLVSFFLTLIIFTYDNQSNVATVNDSTEEMVAKETTTTTMVQRLSDRFAASGVAEAFSGLLLSDDTNNVSTDTINEAGEVSEVNETNEAGEVSEIAEIDAVNEAEETVIVYEDGSSDSTVFSPEPDLVTDVTDALLNEEAQGTEEIEEEVEFISSDEVETYDVNPSDVYQAYFEAYGISPVDENAVRFQPSLPAKTYSEIVEYVDETPAPPANTQVVEQTTPVVEPQPAPEPEPEPDYTDYYYSQDGSYINPALIDEAYLAGLIKTEAGGVANQNGKVGVGLTVLSRMQSDVYPDDMHAVIDQKSQYATPSRSYSESDLEAARIAVELWNGDDNNVLPEDVMYFFGDGRENYFYRTTAGGGVEFVPVPGQTLPDNIYELYRRIVLKR